MRIVGTERQKAFALDILRTIAQAKFNTDVYEPIRRRALFLLHIAEGRPADAEEVLREILQIAKNDGGDVRIAFNLEMYYVGVRDPKTRFGYREGVPERLEDAVVFADNVISDMKGIYYKIKKNDYLMRK